MTDRRLLYTMFTVALFGIGWAADHFNQAGSERPAVQSAAPGGSGVTIGEAFERQASGLVVEAAGTVDKVLRDDEDGSRHQRFILRLDSGETLLVAHNIDVAPRVPLERGDVVDFRGQYEWNERGGVLHWTHHDPDGRRPGGWIRHRGELYR